MRLSQSTMLRGNWTPARNLRRFRRHEVLDFTKQLEEAKLRVTIKRRPVPVGEAPSICDRPGNLAPSALDLSFGIYFLASETSILVAIRFAPSSR